ncbi:hypothetical protein HRJ45_24230 [Vibrio coralliilyticus]|uniref:hypothetical protein n=1 Tax=Vibrio coralliilyticus TaxID=190893 RepID=UPI0015607EF6|nr:hypothetical protein [Vibrio coralliilyticus]NRF28097.1 hypothetical protein [Vibrio coralliilyticus]NRF82221.1 hypothetical protein [Vibrio coralliilyticus]
MSQKNPTKQEQVIEEQIEIETRSAEDKNQFLNELETDFDPDAALAKQSQEEDEKQKQAELQAMADEATKEGVLMALGGIETVLKETVDERLEIGEENANVLATSAVPVIHKYNVAPPPWAVKYKEEIGLGLAVATVAFSLFMQHRSLKKADRQAALERQQKESQEAA